MKIITVCGMGSGSSLILKMNIGEVLNDLGIDADIETCDAGSVNGKQADLIVTTREFEDFIESGQIPVILLTNVIDKTEIQREMETFLHHES